MTNRYLYGILKVDNLREARRGKLIVMWGRKATNPEKRVVELPKIRDIPGEFTWVFFGKNRKVPRTKGVIRKNAKTSKDTH